MNPGILVLSGSFCTKDNSFTLFNGFVTTSENVDSEWQIHTQEAHLEDRYYLSARNVQFRFLHVPLLWLPYFKVNLDAIFDSPIKYDYKWGGKQGSRLSMNYEFFSWHRLKAFFRLDYRLRRGLGAGLETHYRSEDHKEVFETINYWARDNWVITPP